MGRVYDSAAQFEELFTTMFDRIATGDPDRMDPLLERRMVIRFRLEQPDVELWVDGRYKPVQTSFGAQRLDARLTAQLSCDTMHQLLLGTLPLGQALLFRKLNVKGSTTAALELESLLHACQATYPALIAEMLQR